MIRELSRCTMRPARPQRMRQIRYADNAIVAVGIEILSRTLRPALVATDLDRAAEAIGIGHQHGRLRAIELDRRMTVLRHVEAHRNGNHRTGYESERAGHMRGDVDRDDLTGARCAADGTLP